MVKKRVYEINVVGTRGDIMNALEKWCIDFDVDSFHCERNPFSENENEWALTICLTVDEEGFITEHFVSENTMEYIYRYPATEIYSEGVINCRKSLRSGSCDEYYERMAEAGQRNIIHKITDPVFGDHVFGTIQAIVFDEEEYIETSYDENGEMKMELKKFEK